MSVCQQLKYHFLTRWIDPSSPLGSTEVPLTPMRLRGMAWLFISLLFDSNLLTHRLGLRFIHVHQGDWKKSCVFIETQQTLIKGSRPTYLFLKHGAVFPK